MLSNKKGCCCTDKLDHQAANTAKLYTKCDKLVHYVEAPPLHIP